MKKIAILISGRGSNMKAIMDNCQKGILKNIAQVSLVISNNPIAKGLAIAQEAKIPTYIVNSKEKNKEALGKSLLTILEKHHLDLIVLAGFMRVLSSDFVAKYPKKIINIHPADTRLHQGKNGYEWAWKKQLKSTKITVHYVNDELDKGQIIAQQEVNLLDLNSLQQLEKKGLKAEHQLYSQVILQLLN